MIDDSNIWYQNVAKTKYSYVATYRYILMSQFVYGSYGT